MVQAIKAGALSDGTRIYLYYLINPNTGLNSVVATGNGSVASINGVAASYTGAAQSGQPDATIAGSGSSTTSLTTTLATIANSCWTILFPYAIAGGTLSAGTGSTNRVLGSSAAFLGIFDSNAAKSPAGSTSMAVSESGGATDWSSLMVSFAPSIVTATRTPSDSILNGASRSTTVARAGTFARTVSLSIMNNASRLATISGVKTFIRALSQSLMNASGRFASMKAFVNGLSTLFSNKYTKQNSTFNDKFSPQGSTFTDKYPHP